MIWNFQFHIFTEPVYVANVFIFDKFSKDIFNIIFPQNLFFTSQTLCKDLLHCFEHNYIFLKCILLFQNLYNSYLEYYIHRLSTPTVFIRFVTLLLCCVLSCLVITIRVLLSQIRFVFHLLKKLFSFYKNKDPPQD